ncbi:MAG: hypothetical protein ABSH47_18920 [Bryobacteraceae bacterium]|jgi:uncharacterized protein (TIGR03437 family)
MKVDFAGHHYLTHCKDTSTAAFLRCLASTRLAAACRVEYCGAAPLNMPGLLQVNVRPDPAVTPGDAVPVRILIGGTPSQSGVTLVVRQVV